MTCPDHCRPEARYQKFAVKSLSLTQMYQEPVRLPAMARQKDVRRQLHPPSACGLSFADIICTGHVRHP